MSNQEIAEDIASAHGPDTWPEKSALAIAIEAALETARYSRDNTP